MSDAKRQKRNSVRTLVILVGAAFGMLTLGLNADYLYDTFCKITGYKGTTRVAEQSADTIIDRDIRVRFNTATFNGLEWEFKPEQKDITVKLGQNAMVYYKVKNLTNETQVGRASYNVTPFKAGEYFSKIECFCFQDQILEPGEEKSFPVLFFIDPLLDEDRRLNDTNTITLSYVFMPKDKFQAEIPESLN